MSDAVGRPTVAEVSLGALRDNCRRARALVGEGVGVMAVVKADGYGHGAVAAARAFEAGGASAFGVSTVTEGLELRRGGIARPIVVLGGAFPGEEPAALESDLALAVWSREQVERAAAVGRRASVHVKVDTGMTRLGLDLADVAAFGAFLRREGRVAVDGVFSHFASADDVDTAAAHAQIARFEEAVRTLAAEGVRPAHVHLANSAGVLTAPAAHFTLVRPGILLYGYAPAPHLAARASVRPAMRLRTRVAQSRAVPAGRPVGYGGTFVTKRQSAIAVLPIGYADGYHRLGSNRAQALVRGQRVPVAGRICMDHVMLDVTDAAVDGSPIEAGESVVLMGEQGASSLWAEELASWWETIPYEVLTGVGKRVPRVYVEAFDVAGE